jgi:hypothetical protein
MTIAVVGRKTGWGLKVVGGRLYVVCCKPACLAWASAPAGRL